MIVTLIVYVLSYACTFSSTLSANTTISATHSITTCVYITNNKRIQNRIISHTFIYYVKTKINRTRDILYVSINLISYNKFCCFNSLTALDKHLIEVSYVPLYNFINFVFEPLQVYVSPVPHNRFQFQSGLVSR